MALYIKYRPKTLEEFVGNKIVVAKVNKYLLDPDRLHAILITGETGVGKTTLARIISTKLMGCKNYEEIKNLTGFTEINSAQLNGIDFIRNKTDSFNYPGFNNIRVEFFDECSGLTPNAQLGMLKPIEELKDFIYCIFSTSNHENLRQDFIGRCVQFNLKPLQHNETIMLLKGIADKECKKVSDEALQEIAIKSSGKAREALVMLEEIISLPVEQQMGALRGNDSDTIEVNTKEICDIASCDSGIKHEIGSDAPVDKNHIISAVTEEFIEKPVLNNDDQQNHDDMEFIKDATQRASTGSRQNVTTGPKGRHFLPASSSQKELTSDNILKAIKAIACPSAEYLRKKFARPKVLMKPFLNEGSLVMVYAEAGVGKTMFVQFISLILTRKDCEGYSFGNLSVEGQCGVAIIDGEMQPFNIQDRLTMFAGPMGDENPDIPLTIMTSDELFSTNIGRRFNLADECYRAAIYDFIKASPNCKLLILDNIASLTSGISENSKEAWDPINQWLLSFRSLGVAVIIIHHANKAGGYRGSSGRIDNLDTVIALKNLNAKNELSFQIEYIKTRGAKQGDHLGFALKAIPHPENPNWLTWEEQTCETLVETDQDIKVKQIMAYLLATDMKQDEIADIFDVSQAKVSNIKKLSIKRGYLTKKGEVTETGEELIQEFGPRPKTEVDKEGPLVA